MSRVTARLEQDDENQKFVVSVSVYSDEKPKLSATTNIDPGVATDQKHLLALVYAAGAAGAEYMGEKYGENHDPSRCGVLAQEDFLRECRYCQELKMDVSKKIKALLTFPNLGPQDRQRIERLDFMLKRGSVPTRMDNVFINRLYVQARRMGV